MAETLWWPVRSRHAPLGLQKDYFIISENADRIDYLYGERGSVENRKNNLILIMTPEKQDKTLELSKHWSADSTPASNK